MNYIDSVIVGGLGTLPRLGGCMHNLCIRELVLKVCTSASEGSSIESLSEHLELFNCFCKLSKANQGLEHGI